MRIQIYTHARVCARNLRENSIRPVDRFLFVCFFCLWPNFYQTPLRKSSSSLCKPNSSFVQKRELRNATKKRRPVYSLKNNFLFFSRFLLSFKYSHISFSTFATMIIRMCAAHRRKSGTVPLSHRLLKRKRARAQHCKSTMRARARLIATPTGAHTQS